MAAVVGNLNIKETTFRSAINSNSLRATDLVKICEVWDMNLLYELKTNKKTILHVDIIPLV
jgi:hypothetical protein